MEPICSLIGGRVSPEPFCQHGVVLILPSLKLSLISFPMKAIWKLEHDKHMDQHIE